MPGTTRVAPRWGDRDAQGNYPGVDYWAAGVFEGGGAKGVAYAGALKVIEARGCWFSCVAGASAGAITAALIAAGLTAEELERLTPEVLRGIRTSIPAGLWRLKKKTGYFPKAGLRDWLEALLKHQVEKYSPHTPVDGAVTFEQLYRATHIELNVVAANLSLCRQIVFSHLDTPKCQVTEAVLASSSIPFAFESVELVVPERADGGRQWSHTIVDGGVWANFPMFVFEDRQFRQIYRSEEDTQSFDFVLGFLLQEERSDAKLPGDLRKDLREAKFAPGSPALEWRLPERGESADSSSAEKSRDPRTPLQWAMWALARPLVLAWLLPLGALSGIARLMMRWFQRSIQRGRWREPSSRFARRLLALIDQTLEFYQPFERGFVIWGIATLLVMSGVYAIGVSFIGPLFDTSTSSNALQVFGYLALLLLVLPIMIGLVLAMALFLILLIANTFLLPTVRRTGYGLARTYVAGAGAPEWTAQRKNVIALTIPESVTTLSFDIGEQTRQGELRRLIERAEQETVEQFDEFLEAKGLGTTRQRERSSQPSV